MKMYDVFAKSLAVIRNGIAEILARTSSEELFEEIIYFFSRRIGDLRSNRLVFVA